MPDFKIPAFSITFSTPSMFMASPNQAARYGPLVNRVPDYHTLEPCSFADLLGAPASPT